MIKPQIIIRAYQPNPIALKEILAGIEEEGILYQTVEIQDYEMQDILGYKAAKMSQLEVGIGLYKEQASLHIQKIKKTSLLATAKQYRTIGQNAARYVKGNPLIEI